MAISTDVGLDTSVILRLLTGEPPDQAEAAAEAIVLANRNGASVFVSDTVVLEAYFALQTAYNVSKKAALLALAEMFHSGAVQPEPGGCAKDVLDACLHSASKPGFADRMIHARYRSHGAKMLTFEKAASKLPGTEVLHNKKGSSVKE